MSQIIRDNRLTVRLSDDEKAQLAQLSILTPIVKTTKLAN